uniref:Cadmium-induced protein AS8 n=1 Tax=Noccaea caerulescens TaxID=107243 RepID=A0A1J3F259_NOCCA
MVLMIIKGIFRRYEKWNPVHPTYGAFWGMGIGIGCGVGWGPGFGPEVIGYVGAGCGVGFNVGITLAGLGIGLPTNLLLAAPYNTAEATRKGAFNLFGKSLSTDGWSGFMPQVAVLQRQVSEMCSGFNKKPLLDSAIDIKSLPLFISHDCGRFASHLLHVRKGVEDKNRGDLSPRRS